MTAISITPGYPNYSDTDGSALNDGYVYIGLEYQNPITAPTGAFWDQDFRIPADQPLRTSGGYIVRDGSPAAVYTGAAYSILVQNKNLVTVYNAPSAVITNVTNTVEDITQYQGAHATDPLARNDGTPLQVGDLYFNTSINELKVWTGSVWAATSPGNVAVQNFTGTGSQTAFTLSAAPIAENNTQIYIDGVYQQKDTYAVAGATINFSTAPPNLSTIEVVSFSIASLGTVDSSNVSYNQGGTGAVNQSVQSKLQESVSVKDFGAVGDGVTDDAAAIQTAISQSYGRKLFFPAGTYIVKSQYGGLLAGEIVAGGNMYWEGETADTTLKFDPPSNTEGMFGFDLATNAREVQITNLTFDLNNKGSSFIILKNSSASMADQDLVDALLDNVTVKNARMYTTTIGGYVTYLRGGFRSIDVINSTFTDLTIDSGLTPGHVGGAHLVVEPDSPNPEKRYAQSVSIERCYFSNVKCDDPAVQNDMDGVRVFAPLPSAVVGTELVPSSLIVQDSVFADCWTRSIKSKMQLNSVEGCTFKLNSAPTSGSVSPHVDFQHNGGVVENCKFYSKNLSHPGCVSATINNSIEDSVMGMMCTNNQVYHTGTGAITYPFATYGNYAGIMGAVVKNNTVIADVSALLNFNWLGTTANFVCSDNTVKSLSIAVARVTGNGGVARGNMSSNIHLNTGSTVPIAVDSIGGASASAIINGSGNIGVTEILSQYNTGGDRQATLRGVVLGPATWEDGIANYSAGVALETTSVADEATYAFNRRGVQDVAVYTIVGQNFNNNTFAIFAASTAGTVSISAGSSVDLGSTANPDTAGKLNIWVDAATGKVNIKNRLGSARYFTLKSLG